jgi:hypothetical protein
VARQPYECSDWDQIEKFSEIVFNAGYASPVRTPRGRDILAACGQLKSATEKLSARERLALRAMAMTTERRYSELQRFAKCSLAVFLMRSAARADRRLPRDHASACCS